MLPDLAIVIVNWNTRQLLLDCLATLPSATANLRVATWVVDNGSHDGSVAAVQAAFPAMHVIANQDNRGFARANNQAIAASHGRHVLLLNSDTLARPGALTTLVNFLDANPSVAMVGPCLRNADGSVQRSYASFPSLRSELTGRNLRQRKPFPAAGIEAYAVDWIGGACLLVRREALQSFGLLDERYFMYTEETDWCFRARRAGWEVCYLPEAEVVHLGGQSSRMASTRMKAELYRSKLRFFGKHYGRRRMLLLGLALQAGFLGKTLAGGLLARVPGREQQGRAISRDNGLLWQALIVMLRHPLPEEVV